MKTITISAPFIYEGVTILGGWRADIPEATFSQDDAAILRYAREFQRRGISPSRSIQISQEACQRHWEMKALTLVKGSVGWHANTYQDSFGDLLGFDATRVAEKFVPYVPHGRGGIPTMRALMAAMRGEVS